MSNGLNNQGLKATVWEETSSPPRKNLVLSWIKPVASGAINQIALRHTLLFGKPLRASPTKGDYESPLLAKNKDLGMVIMVKIGQSACLLPNSVKLAHGRASETERVWVGVEGLNSRSRSKIQSILPEKSRSSRVLTAIRQSINTILVLI